MKTDVSGIAFSIYFNRTIMGDLRMNVRIDTFETYTIMIKYGSEATALSYV